MTTSTLIPCPKHNSDLSRESAHSSDDGTYNGSNDEDSGGGDDGSEGGNAGEGMERDERDTEAALQLNLDNVADPWLNQDNQFGLPISAELTTPLSQQPPPLTNVEDRGSNPSRQPNIGPIHPCRQTS